MGFGLQPLRFPNRLYGLDSNHNLAKVKMIADGTIFYLAMQGVRTTKPVKGDPLLLLLMLLFFGWVAYLLMVSAWWEPEEKKEDEGRFD